MTLKQHLIASATAFSEQTGMSKARLSTIVVNSGSFFQRLEKGGHCTTATYETFMDWFAEKNFAVPKPPCVVGPIQSNNSTVAENPTRVE